MISNILDHASNNDKKVKTKLLAKVIDQDPASGRGVKDESKVMQETNQLNPEQQPTLSLGQGCQIMKWNPAPLQVYQLFGCKGQRGHDGIHLCGPQGPDQLFGTLTRVISSL